MEAHPPLVSYGVGAVVRYVGRSALVHDLDGGGLVALEHGMLGDITEIAGSRVVVRFRSAYRAAVRAGAVDFERVAPATRPPLPERPPRMS
jgi:hypothetical protein